MLGTTLKFISVRLNWSARKFWRTKLGIHSSM